MVGVALCSGGASVSVARCCSTDYEVSATQGAESARLYTGTANPHLSYDLYERVGFRRRNEHVRYRRPLHP